MGINFRERLDAWIKEFTEDISSCVNNCETPIERILGMEFYFWDLYSFCYYNPAVDVVDIVEQYSITINGKAYRADFAIFVNYPKADKHLTFIIECDGHDYHEKTKEQAQRDKQKDRDLMMNGYIVVRFTGSELYKNSNKCIKDLIKIILRHAE